MAKSEQPERHYPNDKHPNEVDPADCPEVYASIAHGDCLAPVFDDGECFVFSKSEAPCAGDYVGIWLRPDIPHADELPRRVKRLPMGLPPGWTLPLNMAPGSELMPLIELEQFNPPRVLRVPADHILAMHKIIGTAVTNGDGTAHMVPLSIDRKAEPALVEKVTAP